MYLSVGSRPRVTRWGTEKTDVILDPFGWSILLNRERAACHLQPPMSPTQTALSAVLGRGSGTVGVTVRREAKVGPCPPAVRAAGKAGSNHELRAVGPTRIYGGF